MHIHLINPNATAAMTDQALEAAKSVAFETTLVTASTGRGTPKSIEGFSDEALAVPFILDEVRGAEADGANAIVIACFDDPGLDAAREYANGPVIGICQAAIQAAMVVAKRFSIVTTLARSAPAIEDLVVRYGASHACRRVRCIDLPVLTLESEPERAMELLYAEICRARDEDGAEAVVLGCAGMTSMTERLSERTGLAIIDGAVVATKMAEALVGAGLRTSKANAYAFPRIKD